MCIRTASGVLGDVTEPSCMLNVTEGILERVLGNLPQLNEREIVELSDSEAFNFLNRVLYTDLERSPEELWQSHKRYFKYDFLSQGGESFDKGKSFIVLAGEKVRVLFSDTAGSFHSAYVEVREFSDVIHSFFAWLKNEEVNVPQV